MAESLATGWFYTTSGAPGGKPLGPVTWDQLYNLGLSGVLRPDDLVWHTALPQWLPASSVPNLFPAMAVYAPATVHAQSAVTGGKPNRSGRPGWLIPVLIPLVALVVVGAALGVLFGLRGGDNDSTETAESTATAGAPPLIEVVAAAPTVIDVAYITASFTVTPEAGGTIASSGLVVSVPPGAVASNTTIEIKTLTDTFHMAPAKETIAEDEAVSLGPVFDFGPEGLAFDKPVTITVPYYESALPEGWSEDNVRLAYWNGEAWVSEAALVDTKNNTVTARFESFNGFGLIEIVTVTALAKVIYESGKVIHHKLTDPERAAVDGVLDDNAEEYVTPTDPTVKEQAGRAVILNTSTNKSMPLDDPGLAAWLAASVKNKERPFLAFRNNDGTITQMVFDDGEGSNWMKPAGFFTKGTDRRGPFSGDCTDQTNVAVSILIARGFHAIGVYGRGDKGTAESPHAWGEVVIGDQVYRIDGGCLYTEENVDTNYSLFIEYLPITDPASPYYRSTWDDKDQYPYDPNWWKQHVTGDIRPPSEAVVYAAFQSSGMNEEYSGNAAALQDVRGYTKMEQNGKTVVQYHLFVPLYDTRVTAPKPSDAITFGYEDSVCGYSFWWEATAGQTSSDGHGGRSMRCWDVTHTLDAALADINRQIQDTMSSGLTPGWPSFSATGTVIP